MLKKTKIKRVIFGQYDGYRDEPYVNKNSDTETFVALELKIQNAKWSGVPFYVKLESI